MPRWSKFAIPILVWHLLYIGLMSVMAFIVDIMGHAETS